MTTGKSSLWQAAFARKAQCYIIVVHFLSECIKFLTVNKMPCKYVILLIIYKQETITLRRHSSSVWHIKDWRHTSEWLNSRKHKYAILLLLSLYLWSLERDEERKRGRETSWKVHVLLNFYFLQLLVSAHLQWNELEYYLKWNDH